MKIFKPKKYAVMLTLFSGFSVFASNSSEIMEEYVPKHQYTLKETSPKILKQLQGNNHKLNKLKAQHINLPKSVDLSMWADPFDQGDLGSCTANSAAQCILVRERFQLKDNNKSLAVIQQLTDEQIKAKVTPRSRLFLYYSELEKDDTDDFFGNAQVQDDGSSIGTSLLAVEKVGVPDESLWPYDATQFPSRPSQNAYDHAKDNIDDDSSSGMFEFGDIHGMKVSLFMGQPIQVGVPLYPSF